MKSPFLRMAARLALWSLAGGLLLAYYTGSAASQEPARMVNPRDGAAMVWVPAGDFLMGTTQAEIDEVIKWRPTLRPALFADELPQRTVSLDGYWIYTHEVTVAQYRRFCRETRRLMPDVPAWSKDDHPMVNVNWHDAAAYAAWAGVRLPTEAEWEKAARGADGRRFPWGNAWDEEKCNNWNDRQEAGGGHQATRSAPVGSYPASVSPCGAHDMAGNAWEWVADWYAADYYAQAPAKNPPGPEKGEFRVMRGGAWGSSSVSIRVTSRHADEPDACYHDDGGFRCAASGPPPKVETVREKGVQ